jgi:hypothetical protein
MADFIVTTSGTTLFILNNDSVIMVVALQSHVGDLGVSSVPFAQCAILANSE